MARRRANSSAVLAGRVEPKDSLDYFPTPPWATRALLQHVLEPNCGTFTWDLPGKVHRCWEPACGEGDMARPLAEYFGEVIATDVFDYGYGPTFDFLSVGDLTQPADAEWMSQVDWIVTNPPFVAAQDFIRIARGVAREGVAMLARTQFQESGDRWDAFFRDEPPTMIAQFVERVPILRNRVDPKGRSATAYAWYIWGPEGWNRRRRSETIWIPPCRASLERKHDYWRDPALVAEMRRKEKERQKAVAL